MNKNALPIHVRAATKTYGEVRALDDINLDVQSGEFLTLLGPSGSGKTTLLMVLAGFTRPDSGSVRFGDVEVIRMPPHRREVGMVFQNYALFPHMDVAANIAFPLRLRGVKKSAQIKRVENALATVNILVQEMVWFINDQVPDGGDGRFTDPLNSLFAFDAIQGAQAGRVGARDRF